MKKKSKFLSLVLRHAPEKIGVTLDEQGWTDVPELLRKAAAHGMHITDQELHRIVVENDKKRFTLSPDGRRIRAAQGHSVPVDLNIPAVPPPEVLFHGTAVTNLDAIRVQGLKPGTRQQVHLSADTDTARKVGQRHGKPVVLVVNAARMHAGGFEFFQADNGVWLTGAIPAEFLTENN